MKTALTFLAMLILVTWPLCAAAQEQSPPMPGQEQPDVLTRGPVHEAFAEPVNIEVQQGLVTQVQPPANINEIAPAERPQGGNYVWVPGYWAWDADRNNYIWVSACWRIAPPGNYWVPGYWAQVADGWEWVSGFWTPTETHEIEYLPAPPAVVYVQPSIQPSPDTIWVPPCWYWHHNRYIQRPGYWLPARTDWLWVPSHYTWTPRGYIFIGGHWDYAMERRGILFAPVYFPHAVYRRAGFFYSPSVVVDIGALSISLFAYPRYHHYYFGDFYDDAYIRIGIYPWFEYRRFHSWYDPIYEHDRWRHHRSEPRWEERQRHEYDIRHKDVNLRPARTYREMESRMAKLPEKERKDFRTARPLSAYAADKSNHQKFERINSKTQHDIAAKAEEVTKFRDKRIQWESPAAETKKGKAAEERRGPAKQTEREESVTPHKESIKQPAIMKQPAEPKEPMAKTPEHKEQVERKEPITTTPEHKETMKQQTERREPITAQAERKEPATAPTERKEPVTTPTERKSPSTAPAEHKEQVAQLNQDKAAFAPPREVRVTKPERVKVPAAPVVGRQRFLEKGPPSRPDKERKVKEDVKASPDKGQGKKNKN